jgi:hypothetical protein
MKNKTHSALLLLALALGAPSAQAQVVGNVKDYTDEGYVGMDRLTMPLLHYAHTSQMFDGKVLLSNAYGVLPKKIRKTFDDVRGSRDEFTIRQLSAELDAFVEEKAARVREARGFLYELDGKLLEYDFRRAGFPMDLKLSVKVYKSERSYHCLGGHGDSGKPWHGLLTSCLSASNLHSDPAFKFLPIPDEAKARFFREKRNAGELTFMAVAVPDGKYRPMRDQSLRFGRLGEYKVVSGIQPTRIVGLLVVDPKNGDILEIARAQAGAQASRPATPARAASGPDSRPAAPVSPEEPAGVPLVPVPGAGGSVAPGTPIVDVMPVPLGPQSDPQAGPQSDPRPGPTRVKIGGPEDAPTQQMDRLLSLLSFTVYSTPEKINATLNEYAALKARFDAIEGDQARLTLIRQKELKQLAAKLEARERKLELLAYMADLKEEIPAVHGARQVRGAAARKVHYEQWRLADGRHVVVFRGTDNLQDIETDLQLAVNPETVAEVTARMRTTSGPSMLTGLQGVIPGNEDPQGAGRPEAFLSADALVATLVRSGVSPSKIILTGHSLGGGLAQYAGFRNRVGAIVTFNTAPLSAQLRRDAGEPGAAAQLRHYVAFVAGPGGDPLADPVSQKLADFTSLAKVDSLQVVGSQHAIEVCSDLDSPEFTSFMNTAQGLITKGTVAAMGAGNGALKNAATVVGAQAGAVNASTERFSSARTGAKTARSGFTAFNAGRNCLRHPFLCSAAAATGGVVSAVARAKLTRVWTAFSAHRMKNMYEAMERGGWSSCGSELALP